MHDSVLLFTDSQFHLRNIEEAGVGLDGWRDTYIRYKNPTHFLKYISPFPRYDNTKELWVVRHVTKPDFLATSTAPRSSHLLGSHPWTIHNDSRKCMGSTLVLYHIIIQRNTCAEHDPSKDTFLNHQPYLTSYSRPVTLWISHFMRATQQKSFPVGTLPVFPCRPGETANFPFLLWHLLQIVLLLLSQFSIIPIHNSWVPCPQNPGIYVDKWWISFGLGNSTEDCSNPDMTHTSFSGCLYACPLWVLLCR